MKNLYSRKSICVILWLYLVIAAYVNSLLYIESLAHLPPRAERRSIEVLSQRTDMNFTESEYGLIKEQTGLGKAAVNALNSPGELEKYQEIYYTFPDYQCIRWSPISWEEHVEFPCVDFPSLEDGDILITRSSHIMSWRNGHAAIVIDGEKGLTAEAVVIGERSSVQDISKWKHYPNFLVLRLKDASSEERKRIAEAAEKYLVDKPYYVFVGIFPAKYSSIDKVSGTQCAHLVWSAYASRGYDIDSDKGLIVTPKDIADSELLEVVQSYGY